MRIKSVPTIPAYPHTDHPDLEFDMKVLLAVDGSEFTKRMLAWLAVHPEVLGSDKEHACITVTPALPPHVVRYLDAETESSYQAERAQAILAPIEAFGRRHGWKLTTVTAVGHAAVKITEEAATGHYDLLVMGSHGHSALGSLFLGSVAQRVLALCKTPVLLIR
jgi:nucleotide-binding universal stress UspA family protein